ncbi:AMM_1a_G0000880.mRNA.1.CDS.1 [Saccharomyces cerevisiae]|nr:SX2_G0038060.mRNA.1.CDS.1 [Saccharomyces cerevisiae]CAI4240694.1 AMM_1a_G0000880.mRNA.1.CDS.1 [Saccharomyces cerevisiae]CAI4244526.1 CCN_G0000780.mRNA.1.CDS.1 [Saccharomyces cerevisiae]CAI6473883.1 AMM_1a_G0000880.mRNA.1.CDS.1 [Saccharomyces cerevisiae]CAI7128693.1 CCN_G0000780.mRNA.1.CDS.1 [Saccharomyces cerevisiae]
MLTYISKIFQYLNKTAEGSTFYNKKPKKNRERDLELFDCNRNCNMPGIMFAFAMLYSEEKY